MSKRRYSDEFYSELDALIRLQTEQSSKKVEVLEIVAGTDKKTSAVPMEPIYKDSKSIVKMAKTNRLFMYILIFIAFFASIVSGSMLVVYKHQKDEQLIRARKLSSVSLKTVSKPKNNTLNYSEGSQKIDVIAKPVPTNWPQPVRGSGKTILDPKEKLKSVPTGSYSSEVNADDFLPGNQTSRKQETPQATPNMPVIPAVSPVPQTDPSMKESPNPVSSPSVVGSPVTP